MHGEYALATKLSFLTKMLQTSILYFLPLYFQTVNINNLISNKTIYFKCYFCFDLCEGLEQKR